MWVLLPDEAATPAFCLPNAQNPIPGHCATLEQSDHSIRGESKVPFAVESLI